MRVKANSFQENILVRKENGKLADFGIGATVTSRSKKMTHGQGTSLCMAPEVLTSSNYTNKIDVYRYCIVLLKFCSFGLIVLELFRSASSAREIKLETEIFMKVIHCLFV